MKSFYVYLIVLLAALPVLQGCEQTDSLDAIQASGELKVVSRNSPTTFFIGKSGPSGFEYDLAGLLAKDLGVTLDMEPAFSLSSIFHQLRRNEVNLAAAGLTLTDDRASQFPHSVPYFTTTPQVVYVAGTYRPRKIADMAGMRTVALAGSSHAEMLRGLQESEYPELAWDEIEEVDTMELLEMLKSGEAQLAIIDSTEFKVQQTLYPRLKVAFNLGAEQALVWYLPPNIDNARLLARINAFIEQRQADGTLTRLRELHFGHTRGISRIGSHTFLRKMHRSLPPYRSLIKQVANEYQLDWHLLAAIAYQESHWNPTATSPTGVRGMMMLTQTTAREMGVKNRLNPAQSLRGGARYFKNIERRIPKRIPKPDRIWMALAAYNVGMGHLEDARKLTEGQGGNPDRWRDVMERLPLLQKSKYYKHLRFGYARGQEAVTYVQNIRHYYSILEWQDIPGKQQSAPVDPQQYLPESLRGVRFRAL